MGVTHNWKEAKSLQMGVTVDSNTPQGTDRQAPARSVGCCQDLGRPWYKGCSIDEQLRGKEWVDLATSWTD